MRIGALLISALVSGQALAYSADTSYIGVQIAHATYDESGLGQELNPTAIVARLGYNYTENFAIEGRVGIGLSKDSATISGVKASFKIDSLVGFYGVGYLPINKTFSMYALAGYTVGENTVEADYRGYSFSSKGDDSGFSYGIGGEIKTGRTSKFTLEYTSYLDKSEYQITAWSAGLNIRF